MSAPVSLVSHFLLIWANMAVSSGSIRSISDALSILYAVLSGEILVALLSIPDIKTTRFTHIIFSEWSHGALLLLTDFGLSSAFRLKTMSVFFQIGFDFIDTNNAS